MISHNKIYDIENGFDNYRTADKDFQLLIIIKNYMCSIFFLLKIFV